MENKVEEAIELLKKILAAGQKPTDNPDWVNIPLVIRLEAAKILESSNPVKQTDTGLGLSISHA